MQHANDNDLPAGPLETHLTIAAGPTTPVDFDALDAFARRHAMKCLHIVLPRGAHPSQPMLTWRAHGTLRAALARAAEAAGALREIGFDVCRTKIEASPRNAGVPPHDDGGAGRYFESHVKLRLPATADLAPLAAIATRHQSHLSQNARRVHGDGVAERFVTQRVAGAGSVRAVDEARTLADTLAAHGYTIVDVDTEYVVYDSNLAVDAGWIVEG